MPARPWRLLSHPPGDGAWNMAVDEAVAAAVGEAASPPTLRFYAWRRPTLSLGSLQAAGAGIDLSACRERGIPIVRRPTGGRAVLHDRELTYSMALPLAPGWGGRSVAEGFRLIAGALVAGLRGLGVAAALADAASPGTPPDRQGACFQARRMPAILCDGRKLVGSAARRWEQALLQHGSLLLGFDPELHRAVFPQWASPERQVIWLEAILGRLPPLTGLIAAVSQGCEAVFGARCEPGALTLAEERRATELVAARYGTAAWTLRR